jgi:hypothetical protein
MGSVFDGNTKTGLRVADPKMDKTLLGSGSLAFGGMASATGLAGCNGIDAKLVHGDRWQQIDANFTEQVNADEKITILGNVTRMVVGNRTLTTVGNVTSTIVSNNNETVVGSTIRTHVGAAAHTYVSNHVATHASPQNRFEPGVYLHFVVDKLWAGNSLKNIGMLKFEFFVNKTSIAVTNIDIRPVLSFALTGINIQFAGFSNAGRGLQNKVAALQFKVDAMEMEAEMVELGTQAAIKSLSMAIQSLAM